MAAPLPPRSLSVVGADHPNRKGPTRRFEIALMRAGEPVDLVREPRNPADQRAVAVFSRRGVQLGYLTAERCGWISAQIDRGREVSAVFQCKAPWGAVIRVAFDGEQPTLPDAAPSYEPPNERDFYPDEIWPDD